MEEDECDYRTPIGKVIKHINHLCKKPPLDTQLSEAIDLFHETLNEQEKYLANGVFRINFAESALFLQCCTELYGKKVDLLWNELLEVHTRLIKYDYEHQKEKGDPINKRDIDKLEERRNRYLRKKTFKLVQQEEQQLPTPPTPIPEEVEKSSEAESEYLVDVKIEELKESPRPRKIESRVIERWNEVERQGREHVKIPYIVYLQMTRTYRLKNYPILKSEDFEILDIEDREFNTRYSRVPGWHHVLHLVEYNNEGLLPDSKSMIAKLKLMFLGKWRFLQVHNLPSDTPLEKYKQEYAKYCSRFIKEEAKKWQNMPLNTIEDFRKQLEVLASMHCKKSEISGYTLKVATQNDKIDLLDNSDEDSLFELTFCCNKEYRHTDLYVRLEKLSGEIVNTKLRQDSGFYDFSSDKDSETTDTCGNEILNDIAMEDVNKNKEDTINPEENRTDYGNNDTTSGDGNKTQENDDTEENHDDGTATDVHEDNFDTRSYISDHDYCMSPPMVPVSSSDNSDAVKGKEEVLNKTVEDTFKKPLGCAKIKPKVVGIKEPRKKHLINKDGENSSPPKRRKLSQKQIDALLESKITPVKLLKFEKFFSENYQPEDGEGEVPSIEYNSDDSDTEDLNIGSACANDDCDDQDDVRSVYSDHSYCQRLPEDAHNDSGFIEPLSQKSNSELEKESSSNCVSDQATALSNEPEIQNTPLVKSPFVTVPLDQRQIERKEMYERVEEWRNTINPILKNLKERDFDIHEYGSRIIEGMEINDSRPFSDIAQGQTSAEVVRYFISSLQLANTNNIEICGVKPGQLSNDTFNVKLLSKERFHEHLGDYLAPSEETLAEKLEKIRAAKPQQENSVTPKLKKSIEKTYKGKKVDPAKKLNIKIIKLSSNIKIPNNGSFQEVRNACQQDKENCSTLSPVYADNTVKGKSIIKRPINSQHVLNYDISLPSTSRQTIWSEIPSRSYMINPQPSTSSQIASPHSSELFDSDQSRSPSFGESSPNKRRHSTSAEEAFLESLATTQRVNPDIQVHSTPHGPPPTKQVRISSITKKSILF